MIVTACNTIRVVEPKLDETKTGRLLTVYRGGKPMYVGKSKSLVLRDLDDLDMMMHELGHWYHDIHGSSADVDNIVLSSSSVQFIGITKGEDINKRTRMLQDFYNGISRGRVRYRFGHTKTYWSDSSLVLRETYANLFCIWVRGYVEQKEMIKRDFPTLYFAYDSYFKDVTGYTLVTTGGAYFETSSSNVD